MTTYLVTRHAGAVAWTAQQGMDAVHVEHIDSARLEPGDVVVGNVPFRVAAMIVARGARFLALEIELPPALRGRDLDATTMATLGARLVEYHVEKLDDR